MENATRPTDRLPRVLVLIPKTVGYLDIELAKRFREIILELCKRHKEAVFSSLVVSEVAYKATKETPITLESCTALFEKPFSLGNFALYEFTRAFFEKGLLLSQKGLCPSFEEYLSQLYTHEIGDWFEECLRGFEKEDMIQDLRLFMKLLSDKNAYVDSGDTEKVCALATKLCHLVIWVYDANFGDEEGII